MPKFNHKNIGDIQKHVYLEGTILKVYSFDEDDFNGEPEESRIDTADIKIAFTRKDEDGYDEEVEIFGDRIPIFYHCSHDVEKLANGALEGASVAFSEDDEIIVQCEILSDKHYKPLRVMGFIDKPKPCNWCFKLFRDDDTTKRDAAGNIIEASGTLIDPTLLYNISIVAGGERISLHINNYVVDNKDGTYTLKNKKREDFVFGDYWTFSGSIWYYDDTAGYPYDPEAGLFNPLTGQYTVSINPCGIAGLSGNYGYDAKYWIFNEEDGIWYFDDSEDYPDDPWTGSYNPATGYYTIDQKCKVGTAKVVAPAVTAPDDTKFWLAYNCREYFVPTNQYERDDGYWRTGTWPTEIIYPYKYKRVDSYEQTDKIAMGTYEGNIPYWELADQWFNPEPVEKPWNWTPDSNCDVTTLTYAPGTSFGNIWFKNLFAIQRILKTSIPYKTQFILEGGGGVGGAMWHGFGDYSSEGMCGSISRCTDIEDCAEQSAHKKSTMYYTDDDLVNLSYIDLYYDVIPHIQKFISDLITSPDSIETEIKVKLNIKTQQSNFCYVCYDEDLEEYIYKSTNLINVKLRQIFRAIKIYSLYE